PARLVKMAELAVAEQPGDAFNQFVLAYGLYRGGRHEEALKRLQEVQGLNRNSQVHLPLLAMVLHRLGRAPEAKQVLDVARRVNESWTESTFRATVGSLRVNWKFWMAYQVSYREARGLIEGGTPREDPRWRAIRARSLAALKMTDKADAEYAAAVKERPDD